MAKPTKRILSVTVKKMYDVDSDTSWMGEYSDRPKSEYTIDRKHSLDCYVNEPTEYCFYQSSSGQIELQIKMEDAESVSHSGECDSDVAELLKFPYIKTQLDKIKPDVLSAVLKEYGAWDAEELANHGDNLARLLWLAGGDITDQHGCNCGERGDMERGDLRYFNGPVENYKGETPEDIRKYVRQDYERMEALNRGYWCFVGVRAEAKVTYPVYSGVPPQEPKITEAHETAESGGIWGNESDMSECDWQEVYSEQLAELKDQLLALGFSRRAIATAYKSVEYKDGE